MSTVRVVAAHISTVRWPIASSGSARGRSERAAVLVELETATGERHAGEAAPLPDHGPDAADRDSLARARDDLHAFALRLPLELATTEPRGAVEASLAEITSSPSARFAIETALLSAIASARHCRVRDLLALDRGADLAAPTPLAIAHVVDTVDEALGAVAAHAAVLKIKLADPPDLDRVRAIAHATAAHAIPIRLDANQSWPAPRVPAYLAALAALPELAGRLELVEEPCADTWRLLVESAASAASTTRLPIPLALDESLATLAGPADLADLDRALAAPDLAALVLKPTLLGGAFACLALAARARARGVPCIVTHALEGPVGTAACVELAHALASPRAAGLAPHPALASYRGVTARIIVATPTAGTLAAVESAWREDVPVGMIHHRLPAEEQARQRADLEHAALPVGTGCVLYTSGSTATARGVVISRAAIDAAVAASASRLGWRPGDRWLLALSTAHAGGLAVLARCRAATPEPVPVVLLADGEALADRLADATLASLVPTQLATLLADPAWHPPATLRAILLGGAAAPPGLLADAAARGVPFLLTYGMTEAFGQVATAPLAHAGDPAAPLVPLPGVTIEAGTLLDPARVSVRAPMLATAYLGGAAIAPILTTSDLGYLDAAGALHVIGRADDVIITGGENVHPLAVEAVLARTPGVLAAVVFAVADERWGQRVAAAITTARSGFDLPAATAYWRAHLAPHALPRELALAEVLPLTATGKLDRRAAACLPRVRLTYAR